LINVQLDTDTLWKITDQANQKFLCGIPIVIAEISDGQQMHAYGAKYFPVSAVILRFSIRTSLAPEGTETANALPPQIGKRGQAQRGSGHAAPYRLLCIR
jgi:hypothetical protein